MEVQHGWEISKENVLPSRKGRNVNKLNRALATLSSAGARKGLADAEQ